MIDFIFTLDYEIYGDGTGSLSESVHEPTEQLLRMFCAHGMRFVAFVEVVELEKIEAFGTDRAIDCVRRQVLELHRAGFEIGLHLHPQWANGRYLAGEWDLDLTEYNLCTLPRKRIEEIVENGINYLRYLVDDPRFMPLSFRAGNWLFQPTSTAAAVLGELGIKIDSSVFKGGLQRHHSLDYRAALNNGYFWRFEDDVNLPDSSGHWTEVPIHTEMVRPWKMTTSKRMKFSKGYAAAARSKTVKLSRSLDFLRWRYPLKLDFTRMTLEELVAMTERILQEDNSDPGLHRPIVAIGHTKDLTDPRTIEMFLSFLKARGISVTTFAGIYPKLVDMFPLSSGQSHLGPDRTAHVIRAAV